MREIRFRGWHKARGEMFDIQRISFKNNKVLPYGWNIPHDGDQFELMQFTGLFDDTGKKIYEGDVLEGGYENLLAGGFISRKYIIEYDNGCFKGQLIGHTPYGDTWLSFIKGKIIGNIYENPELLEA